MNCRILLAALAATVALGACSQKDPAQEAITAAENALNAVYEEAAKYVPERYAEVKKDLETARAAFKEERYADAIAAVRNVPADAEALAKEASAASAGSFWLAQAARPSNRAASAATRTVLDCMNIA